MMLGKKCGTWKLRGEVCSLCVYFTGLVCFCCEVCVVEQMSEKVWPAKCPSASLQMPGPRRASAEGRPVPRPRVVPLAKCCWPRTQGRCPGTGSPQSLVHQGPTGAHP